jgi:hypothetical protein
MSRIVRIWYTGLFIGACLTVALPVRSANLTHWTVYFVVAFVAVYLCRPSDAKSS